MQDRMEEAYLLASKCWASACSKEPEFVKSYLQVAYKLLCNKQLVRGEEFKHYCRENGIRLPINLHHNTWVSGVRALFLMGWIHPVKKVEPVKGHNHMDSVTLWRSNVFAQSEYIPDQSSLF